MGCSRIDSLLLFRVVTHLDILGFYLRQFDLFAITQLSSQSSYNYSFLNISD